MRDGESQFGRGRRNDRARAPRALGRSRAPERMGLPLAPSCARLVLCRLAENLAPRRGRPHARQWARQQVQRVRRERDGIGSGLPHADVRRQAVYGDAGVFLRAIGAAGGGHARRARLDRSHLRRRRGHHGPPGRAGRRRARAEGILRRRDRRRSGRTLRFHPSLACGGADDGLRMSESAGLPAGVLVAFYGDDFTGSSAVMEVMTFAGLPAVVFVGTPTPEQLERFHGYRAIGIAGVARAMPTSWMDANLPDAFRALAELKAPVTHYKICSTLDSSPTVGSIGRAIDIGAPIFSEAPGAANWQPLVVAAPAIGRYQAFGNLFAASGDCVYRLDRHPVMRRHPVTPMDEADVRLHVGKQTSRAIGLVDFVAMKRGAGLQMFDAELERGRSLLALDIVDDETLRWVGELMWRRRRQSLFAIGSQGVEYALVAHWRAEGWLPDTAGRHSASEQS